MGIGLKDADWHDVVADNRKRTRCRCEEKVGKFCIFHGWSRTAAEKMKDNIKATPQGDAIIRSRMQKRDDAGRPVVSTARCRRRKERLKE